LMKLMVLSTENKRRKKKRKRKCFLGLYFLYSCCSTLIPSDGCSQVVDTGNQISSKCLYIVHLNGN
jgi:hypothetical protein